MLILPPRTSWLYRASASISSTRRYLITILFLAICIAVWFHYIYEPLGKRIAFVQQQQAAFSRGKSVSDLSQEIDDLRTQLTQSPPAISIDDQLNLILGYVDQAGMTLEHCSVQEKALMVQASGTYKQFLLFFEQLSLSTQRLLPRDIRITRNAENTFQLSLAIEAA